MTNIPISCCTTLVLTLAVFHFAHGHWSPNPNISVHNDILQHQKYINNSTFSQTISTAGTSSIVNIPSGASDECVVQVKNRSAYIFQQILKKHRPHFVQFRIKIDYPANYTTDILQPRRLKKDYPYPLNYTTDVFQPGRWYWTFSLMSKPYQFLSWDIRYGLFTFGLLDFKTSLVPTVFMTAAGKCNLTLGTQNTSELITRALIPLINVDSSSLQARQYKENYFCYLVFNEDIMNRNTFEYIASIYLLYPIIYIDYKCCFLQFNFTIEYFNSSCSKIDRFHHQWTDVLSFNIIFGLMIIAICPLLFFRLFAWLGGNAETEDSEQRLELMNELPDDVEESDQEEWIFANGNHPLTFFDVISFRGLGIERKWPVFVSRLRRFIGLLLAPSVIYIVLLMNIRGIGVWYEQDRITIKDFVDVGSPVGFMSLLGDARNRYTVFVPALGGPVGITVIYFVFGFFFLVCPKSLKNVVDNGLPTSTSDKTVGQLSHYRTIKSPLFFGVKEIITLSQINVDSTALQLGYSKCATLMKCNFYMLFTMKFWFQVLSIQKTRLSSFRDRIPFVLCLICMFFLPFYVAICLLEMVLCVLYFGVPFFFFLIVMVRAAMRMIPYLRRTNRMFSFIFRTRFIRYLGNIVLFISIILFAYCMYLLIVASLKYVSQIITYCFIAVIVFPSVSFGSLFLFVVIIYYIIRQLKLFSYSYTSLLFSTIAISKRIKETHNHVTSINGHLVITNVTIKDVREIELNGRLLDASQIVPINRNAETLVEMKMAENCYGIPKELYKILVRKYRPVHKQVLSLLLRVSILTACIALFLSITHIYPLVSDDQITEVLHVIFIIAVGALPKLIESDLVSQLNTTNGKIEKKLIEQTIIEYWTRRQC